MRITRVRRDRRDGVAAVEFGLTMPLLLIILVGIWEVGRMVQVKQIVSNAAREGARQASTGSRDYDAVNESVQAYLRNSGLNAGGVVVEIRNITTGDDGPQYDASRSSQLDELEVMVSLPFENVRWAALDQITDIRAIEATSRWYSAKDVPIAVDLTGSQIPRVPAN